MAHSIAGIGRRAVTGAMHQRRLEAEFFTGRILTG